MIVDLPSTSTTAITRRLVALRNSVGAMAMGRVLTLLVSTDDGHADAAVEAANAATRQHPARIIVVVHSTSRGANRLDGQIRVGGDAGASEVVVLRLYGQLTRHADAVVRPLLLPDSPIVAWWPQHPPADVAASPLGAMANRRITDASTAGRPLVELGRRAKHYVSGDTDLAWTRITRWRALLASALDRAPYEPVTDATVTAEVDSPSADLLAGWLGDALQIKVRRARSEPGTGLRSVRLVRESGPIDLVLANEPGKADRGDRAAEADLATLTQPGQPVRQVPITVPPLTECLAQELRRLDADQIYADALIDGRRRIRTPVSRTEAISAGDAPDDTLATTDRILAHGGGSGSQEHQDARVHSDPDELAAAVAAALDEAVTEAVRADGVAHLGLTGGSMGGATIAALAARDLDPQVWQQVHLWWGDERFVPLGDPDRNDQQAADAGLGDIPVPAEHVHRVPGADPGRPVRPTARVAAAAEYADALARYAADPGATVPRPDFTVMLLGIGPDAHVASLFPGREELLVDDRAAVAVSDSPKPPADRVTLTAPVICSARQVWFVAAGTDKAGAVALGRRADHDPLIPASWVRGRDRTVWWLDTAAAGNESRA